MSVQVFPSQAASGLRGAPVADAAALAALTPADYERRKLLDTKLEYVFEFGATPGVADIPDGGATGAWVRQSIAAPMTLAYGRMTKNGLTSSANQMGTLVAPIIAVYETADNPELITANTATGEFTIIQAGKYRPKAFHSVESRNDDIFGMLFVDGVEVERILWQIPGTTATGAVFDFAKRDFTVGQVVTFRLAGATSDTVSDQNRDGITEFFELDQVTTELVVDATGLVPETLSRIQVSLSANSHIGGLTHANFDQELFTQGGGLTLNASGAVDGLKAGKTYKLTANMFAPGLAIGGTNLRFVDLTADAQIGEGWEYYSASDPNSASGLPTQTAFFTPAVDSSVGVDHTGGTIGELGVWSTFTVEQVPAATVTTYSGGGAGDALNETIAQAAHGFTVLQPVYHNGTDWQAAQADAGTTTAQAIVTAVADAGNFVITTHGTATSTAHGLTVGEYYWLDQTTSALTSTAPTGGISQPLGHVRDVDTLFIDIEQPLSGPTLGINANDQAASGFFDIGAMRIVWGRETVAGGNGTITFPASFKTGTIPAVTVQSNSQNLLGVAQTTTNVDFLYRSTISSSGALSGSSPSYTAIGLKP